MDTPSADLDLTKSQTLILTGQLLQPDEPLYNMVLAFRIRGPLDPELFQAAFSALVRHCDALRTTIIRHGDGWKQHLSQDFSYKPELVDLSGESEPQARLSEWIGKRCQRLFSLDQCLFDSALVRMADDDHIWYLNQHHLMTDAWSMQVLFKKQQELYALAGTGRLAEARDLPAYRDYVLRESAQGGSTAFDKARAYWQDKLKTTAPASQFYRQTPGRRSGRTRRLHCRLGAARSGRLLELAQAPGFRSFTLDMSLMQLFSTVLLTYIHRMTGNEDLSLGTPTHSRTSTALKDTVGLLIEIFPLKVRVEEDESFSSLFGKIARANREMLMHALPGATDFEQNRAFDVLLNYIPSSFGSFADLPTESDWVHPGYGDRNHLLRLQVHNFDQSDEFTLHFDVNEEVFVGAEQQWVIDHFLRLLDALLESPEQGITLPPLLPRDTQPPYQTNPPDWEARPPIASTVIDCFKGVVTRTPDRPALACRGKTISYRELDERSTDLAISIRKMGAQPESVVAVSMRRSIEAVVAILGVLKSGAVLLPVDPAYPSERIDFILQDAGAALLLNEETDASAPGSPGPELPGPQLEDDAYVIYTSGSTGAPKGVLVSHRSLSNYIQWARAYYLDDEPLDFALFSSLSFDLTLTSLLVPLVSGGRLVIYPEPADDSEILIRSVIEDNQVDAIKLTPAHLVLIQSMDFSRSRLKKVIVGGEDFKTETARALSHQFGHGIDIYNEYGPTEGTVACTVHRYDEEADQLASVPIGRPISNAIVHVFDGAMNPVPQGVTGEIYIGGMGVARRYLNREQLTAERFVKHPLDPGEVLYRTGDLARWNEKSQIEYLGRNDQQVKIRGVRIETSEVEAALLGLDEITDVVVDVAHTLTSEEIEASMAYCQRCGLAGNHPSAQLDQDQVCRICRIYERDQAHAHDYFRTLDDLHQLIDSIRRETPGKQNSIMLLSGGKDSSYALCRLVDMGLTPLVFTLDNGFISDGAKANIRRLVDHLGLEMVVGETPAMNEIFVDSLKRHSNVCNGCFKTIYTLSMNLARERGIRYICTGLSRGQIFETRVAHLFQQGIFDPAQIDEHIIEARKAYHRAEDVIARNMDVEIFADDAVFEDIQYLDFYRYTEVTLAEVMEYLATRAPWIRPSDTGRSTNCLINDAGISVHKQERGYHNYALPYSWDVRLGHKDRDAALDELNDDLDSEKVDRILREVGYAANRGKLDRPREDFLVAYYVAPYAVAEADMRDRLRRSLPVEFIPRFFLRLDELPLSDNGKVDRQALPRPDLGRRETGSAYVPPETETQTLLVHIWTRMLGLEGIGIEDNFFELGGDSITNIQIVAAARECGISITPQQIFDYPTIRGLAAESGSVEELTAEQGPVTGETMLLPSQHRYFSAAPADIGRFNQSVVLACKTRLDTDTLRKAIARLLEHHDALRSSFDLSDTGWAQQLLKPGALDVTLLELEVKASSHEACLAEIERHSRALYSNLNMAEGNTLAAAHIVAQPINASYLFIAVNHLVIDGVSWWILLSDLETLYRQIGREETPKLPPKSTSIQQWAHALGTYAESIVKQGRHRFWLENDSTGGGIPCDQPSLAENDLGSAESIVVYLPEEETRLLLQDVPGAYSVQVPEVLLTALLKTVLPWSGKTGLRIDIEGHGREDLIGGFNLTRTVGWFTSIYPISLQLSGTGQPGTDIKRVKEQLRAVPLRGVEYGILRYLSDDSETVTALQRQPAAELLFNYMGQWEKNLSAESQFSFARPIQAWQGTEGTRTHLLEINAMIFNGRLEVEWTFSRNLHEAAVMENLSATFLQQLRELISYCVNTEESSLTPSDFPESGLKQDDLDELLSEFGE